MKTLYIDIYFLINFTVDAVALYFAALLSKIKTTNRRLIISSLIGAVFSCIAVLLDSLIFNLLGAILTLFIIVIISCKRISAKRTVLFSISFLVFLCLIGGFVSYFWTLLEDIFANYVIENDKVNRKILFLSIIILLSIGVFKMFITVMNSGNHTAKVTFKIKIQEKCCESEALVDTGNLAIDPMSMRPILIIKRTLAEKIISPDIIDLINVDSIPRNMKKRIRLIPITRGGATHVLVGLMPDSVKVRTDKGYEDIDVTIAIDKEGGDFGGFFALMPESAIKNVNTKNN